MEIVLVVMIAFSVVVVGWLAFAQSGEPPAPGMQAPDFRLHGIDGGEHSISARRGNRAVIVFHPQDETPECLAIVRRLAAAVPAIESAGARLATIVVSGPEAAQAYANAHGTLHVLCDPGGRTAKSYGALVNLGFMKFARKLIVLVDSQGRVERVWRDRVGPTQVDELLDILNGPPR